MGMVACANNYRCATSNPATVRGSFIRKSLYYWDRFDVMEIDGLCAWGPMYGANVKVDSGHHEVVVAHHGNRGLFGEAVTGGYLPIQANFKPQRRYEVTGNGTGGMASAWIRDVETGETVSNISKQALTAAPRESGPIIIPIVVH